MMSGPILVLNPSAVPTSRKGGLVLCFTLLFLAGCQSPHSGLSKRATAPGLRDSDGAVDGSMARNVAAPNGPYTLAAAKPRLAVREAILDVDGVPACAPGQLGLFESRAQANGLRHTVRFTLSNQGSACRIGGFPSVSLLGADGTILGQIRLRKVSDTGMAAMLATGTRRETAVDGASPQILLPSQGHAAFDLGWTTGPACVQVSRIAIAAPGSTETVVIPRTLSVCEDQVLVTQVASAE